MSIDLPDTYDRHRADPDEREPMTDEAWAAELGQAHEAHEERELQRRKE